MKWIWRILALAMIGEGITLCVAQRQYLNMWKSTFGQFGHWLNWFEKNQSKTRAIATIEICCGVLLLRRLQ